MNTTVKVTGIGNSLGIILSKELLAKLRVDKGDMLYITETPQGLELRGYDEKFARQMAVGEEIMRENRDALKKLAE